MISPKKYGKLKLVFNIIILLLLPLYVIKHIYTVEQNHQLNEPKYVGKEACISCHEAEYKAWEGSHHDRAMDTVSKLTVLGDFNDAELMRNGQRHRCFMQDGKYMVYTDGEDGEMHNYEVKYVFGFTPLQNYLVEFSGGRLQTLALTWNSVDSNWFYMSDSVYKNENVNHDNWLHWSNQAQNWNSMCAYCHSTNLKKAYNHETDEYNTTWSEIDVSCEACHGPSSLHVEWADMPKYAQEKFDNYALVEKTSGLNNFEYVDKCARCHSRRTIMNDYDYRDKDIYDHIVPNLPIEPNYYIDGQIKEEDYVYGSFIQSKMYMNEVMCNDCHNVHSGELVMEGNDLCLQCHKFTDYNTVLHHFHKNYGEEGSGLVSESGVEFEVGSGTECINCHMHGSYFMGVDYRRDHSFRIPRPDLSDSLNTPNACNQCHTDKSNKWSQEKIEEWFGKSRQYQFAQVYGASDKSKKMREIISDEVFAPSIRNALLVNVDAQDYNNKQLINKLLNNDETSLRLHSSRMIQLQTQDDIDKILAMLYDDVRAIRIDAASKLVYLQEANIPEKYKESYKKALEEYKQSMYYNADNPLGKYNLGNYYYATGNLVMAEKYYLAALKQDEELDVVKMNLSIVYSSLNKPLLAEKYLKSFVENNPDNGEANYNYALILAENKKYDASMKHLMIARKLMPNNANVDYNIAMMHEFYGEVEKTEEFLLSSISKDITNVNHHSNLLNFYVRTRQIEKSQDKAKQMINIFPDNEEVQKLRDLF